MNNVIDILEVDNINNNIAIFNELKGSKPSLANVQLLQNTLVFPEGRVSLEGIDLSQIDVSIFSMSPSNLYIYFSNGFYKHDEQGYNEEINTIFELFLKFIITEDEETFLKRFAYDFWLRLVLFSSEPVLANDEAFGKELYARRKVITESYQSVSIAASIITKTYNQNLQQSMDLNQQYDNDDNTNNQSHEKGLSLVRTNSSVPKLIDDEDDNRLGIAGYASILLVIGTTLVMGLLLGFTFIK